MYIMSKKQILLWVFVALASVAIILGFCFVFLGNDIIENAPGKTQVQNVDGDFYLVTEYSGEYGYQFKLEQLIDDEYVVVDYVDSDTNMINLSEQKLNILAGEQYRFSACYTTENGSGNSAFSEALVWQPSWNLDTIVYDSVLVDTEKNLVSWQEIYLADSYRLKFLDTDGEIFEATTASTSFSLNDVPAGKFTLYIFAESDNDFLLSSVAGEGKQLEIVKKNQILSTNRENGLTVVCSEKVDSFEIYENGVLKGVLKALTTEEVENGFVYTFSDVQFVLGSLDFENSLVQIKSLATDFVEESDFSQIV